MLFRRLLRRIHLRNMIARAGGTKAETRRSSKMASGPSAGGLVHVCTPAWPCGWPAITIGFRTASYVRAANCDAVAPVTGDSCQLARDRGVAASLHHSTPIYNRDVMRSSQFVSLAVPLVAYAAGVTAHFDWIDGLDNCWQDCLDSNGCSSQKCEYRAVEDASDTY